MSATNLVDLLELILFEFNPFTRLKTLGLRKDHYNGQLDFYEDNRRLVLMGNKYYSHFFDSIEPALIQYLNISKDFFHVMVSHRIPGHLSHGYRISMIAVDSPEEWNPTKNQGLRARVEQPQPPMVHYQEDSWKQLRFDDSGHLIKNMGQIADYCQKLGLSLVPYDSKTGRDMVTQKMPMSHSNTP